MKNIELDNKTMELIEECMELYKILHPTRSPKTDKSTIQSALKFYKWYLKEEIKLK